MSIKFKKDSLIYLLFFISIFVISMQSKKLGGDDVDFTNQILSEGRLNWLYHRYFNWSGRLSSDLFVAIFLPAKQFVWSLFNSFFASVLLYSISCLIFRRKQKKLLFCLCLLGYVPLAILIDTTFWITGSFNYLWVISLGLFSLILVYNESENIHTQFKWIYILAGILASFGVEQMGVCLLSFALLANLKVVYKQKKLNITLFFYLIIIASCITVVLASPGSSIRVIEDSNRWFPDFMEMTFFEKIRNGISWQINYWTKYLLAPNILLAVSELLILNKMKKNRNIIILKKMIIVFLSVLSAISILGLNNLIIPVDKVLLNTSFFYIFWIIFYTLIYGLAIYMTSDYLETLFLILATIFSGSVMFFSPTIFASGARSLGVPFVFLIIVIGKFVENNQLLGIQYFKLICILPIINIMYLIYWLINQGFSPHSFM